MTKEQWNQFLIFKAEFKQKIEAWKKTCPNLSELQKKAATDDGVPFYPIENPIVYNKALDEILETTTIKLIVVGDNPGKNEQLSKNQRYLVGQSGKIAEGFFKRNEELQIDFRKNVIILNKTPIHTAKTKELSYLLKNADCDLEKKSDSSFKSIFLDTQVWFANKTCELAKIFNCPIWLVGYGELKSKALFAKYLETIKNIKDKPQIFVFQHFSMNRFSIDLKNYQQKKQELKDIKKAINELGLLHRQEILGW